MDILKKEGWIVIVQYGRDYVSAMDEDGHTKIFNSEEETEDEVCLWEYAIPVKVW